MTQPPAYFETEPVKGDQFLVPVTNKYGAEVIVGVTVGNRLEDIKRYENVGRPLVANRAFRASVDREDRERATAETVILEVTSVLIEDADDRRNKRIVYKVKG